MYYFKLLITIAILGSVYGCNKCGDKPLNQVNIRVQNDLDFDIEDVSIGTTMYKSNESFASCNLSGGFDKIDQGATSDYLTTYGRHAGYDGVRVQWIDQDRQGAKNSATQRNEEFQQELLRNGGFEDSVANVYNGKMIYGIGLPDGNYTFRVFDLSDNKNVIEVEITKD